MPADVLERTPQEIAEHLQTDLVRGLSASESNRRQAAFGANELAEGKPTPSWKRFLAQFRGLVVWILIVAAVIAGVVGEWADTAAILAIVFINGVFGFLQEERAGRALAALKKLSSPHAKVVRDGVQRAIPARELVPGDRIELEAGDHVPADARLIQSHAFRVQEAALTGESSPVDKDAELLLPAHTPLADRTNSIFMGTVTAAGKASAIVIRCGMDTELGRIAGLLAATKTELTPLQRRLEGLGRILVFVCLGIVAVIFGLQLLRGGAWLETFLVSISLAVAAVPEGLPAVVTLTLALGVQRMAQRNALVRKLPSVETLGSVTVICSDKTGTLTRNEMTVREALTNEGLYRISGAGYVPQGRYSQLPANTESDIYMALRAGADEASWPEVNPLADRSMEKLLAIAAVCGNASVHPAEEGGDGWNVVGDPTEGALLVAAMKAGLTLDSMKQHVVYELPFDSDRKMMSVVVQNRSGSHEMCTKGAVEVLLGRCTQELQGELLVAMTGDRIEYWSHAARLMAARALRVLAFAYRPHPGKMQEGDEETGLVFVGLLGMIDPPREDAIIAVQKCREAGIRPVMITGDHPATAQAVAEELKIMCAGDRVLTGAQIDAADASRLASDVRNVAVFARVTAEHKLKIVSALRQQGHVVAMTGDGVNDAPAIKAADIGIAMGVTGTDVTKEAASIVLVDDNFASIVNAVEEGRGIFDNIQKFATYLLASNAGEVLLMLFAAIVGWPVPLMAIQILWINLVTDGVSALALGLEPPERDIMRRPPRPASDAILSLRSGGKIVLHGTLLAAIAALGFWIVYQGQEDHLARARTVAFCVTAFSQLFLAIGYRSSRYTMPELGLFTNPHLFVAILISALLQLSVVTLPFAQPLFEVATHLTWEWTMILGLSLIPVTLVEVAKWFYLPAVRSQIPRTST